MILGDALLLPQAAGADTPESRRHTSRDIVNRLHNELAQFMKAETVKWSRAVKTSGAKVE